MCCLYLKMSDTCFCSFSWENFYCVFMKWYVSLYHHSTSAHQQSGNAKQTLRQPTEKVWWGRGSCCHAWWRRVLVKKEFVCHAKTLSKIRSLICSVSLFIECCLVLLKTFQRKTDPLGFHIGTDMSCNLYSAITVMQLMRGMDRMAERPKHGE